MLGEMHHGVALFLSAVSWGLLIAALLLKVLTPWREENKRIKALKTEQQSLFMLINKMAEYFDGTDFYDPSEDRRIICQALIIYGFGEWKTGRFKSIRRSAQ